MDHENDMCVRYKFRPKEDWNWPDNAAEMEWTLGLMTDEEREHNLLCDDPDSSLFDKYPGGQAINQFLEELVDDPTSRFYRLKM